MKRIYTNLLLLVMQTLISVVAYGQVAEYNTGNNWLLPGANKMIGMDFVNSISGSVMNHGTIWYKGNFQNDGTVSYDSRFAPNPGLSRFEGTSAQRISGKGRSNFYSVMFNNALGFSLEQDIFISGKADFTKGIVTSKQTSLVTPENRVNMLKGSSLSNVSDQSHVDGFVNKTGDEPFTFPIGNKGRYRWAAISTPAQATDGFAARYVLADPTDYKYPATQKASGVGAVSSKEFWVVNRTNGTSDIDLTLSWDATTSDRVIPDKMGIVRWNNTQWVPVATSSLSGDATSGKVTSKVSDYGIFTLAAMFQVPVAADDKVTVYQNTSASGSVADNDTPSGAGGNVWKADPNPAKGALLLEASTGKFTYTPQPSYSGSDSFWYTLSDPYNNSSKAQVQITVLPINDKIEFYKKATTPTINLDGSYSLKYTISIGNKTGGDLENIKVEDDLSKVFVAPVTYSVAGIAATGSLKANSLYDGKGTTAALLDGSRIVAGKTDSVMITVNVEPHTYNGEVVNYAYLNTSSKLGEVTNLSSDDITNATAAYPRPTVTRLSPVAVTVPSGFSPNNDGYNDKFVIEHDANLSLNLRVYNRAGTLVYSSSDYQNDWEGKGVAGLFGQDLLNGTYYYTLETTNKVTGETKQYTGFITLQR